jgi:polysaccharide export outer membrane protein
MSYCRVNKPTTIIQLFFFTLFLSLAAAAQERLSSISKTNTRGAQDIGKHADEETVHPPLGVTVADYIFGAGDVVSVSIADSPELSGTFQVSDQGYIALPLLSEVKAAGINGTQLTKSISDKLRTAELLAEPIVNVAIQEYHSRTVLVLGAVVRPAAYPLQRPTTLLDVISLAGGLAPNAGNTVTVAHQAGVPEEKQTIDTVNLSKLVRGSDPLGNIQVHAGDVVNVSTAPVIYVVGAVTRPGGFVMEDPGSGVTVIQAIALAEGLLSIAAPKQGFLIRKPQDGKPRQEIPVDVDSILKQKGVDQSLQPNDILFIPESGSKKTLQAMVRVAEGVAIYGAGMRLAGY